MANPDTCGSMHGLSRLLFSLGRAARLLFVARGKGTYPAVRGVQGGRRRHVIHRHPSAYFIALSPIWGDNGRQPRRCLTWGSRNPVDGIIV